MTLKFQRLDVDCVPVNTNRRMKRPCRWYHPMRNSRSHVAIVEQAAGMNQRSFLAGKSIVQGGGSIDATRRGDRPPRR